MIETEIVTQKGVERRPGGMSSTHNLPLGFYRDGQGNILQGDVIALESSLESEKTTLGAQNKALALSIDDFVFVLPLDSGSSPKGARYAGKSIGVTHGGKRFELTSTNNTTLYGIVDVSWKDNVGQRFSLPSKANAVLRLRGAIIHHIHTHASTQASTVGIILLSVQNVAQQHGTQHNRHFCRFFPLSAGHSHLKPLNVSVQTLAVIPHRLEAQHVPIVLDETGPLAVVYRVAQGCLCEDFHVVLHGLWVG